MPSSNIQRLFKQKLDKIRAVQQQWVNYVDETVATAAALRTQALDLVLTEPFDSSAHSTKISIGTLVAYSVQFLRSIGMSHTWMGRAKGTVQSFKMIGSSIQLALVKWHCKEWRDLPSKVNIVNLAPVGPNTKYCAC